MGSFSFEIPKVLEEQLQKQLKDFDKIAPKMLEEAAPIVEKKVKEKAPVKTGQLQKSVKINKPKKSKSGAWISAITFNGKNKKTLKNGEERETPNATIAAVLEFGKSDRSARPFVRPAVAECENEVVEKMQEVFNREASR